MTARDTHAFVYLLVGAVVVPSACASSVATTKQSPSAAPPAEQAKPCSGALFCDDFESYSVHSAPGGPWSNHMNGGTVTVDTAHAYSGARSVKVSAASAAGYRSVMISLSNTAFLPPPSKVLYGRMMFWLDSAPATSVHWTFIDAGGTVPGQSYQAVYRYGGNLPITSGTGFVGSQLMASYETPDSYATPAVGVSSDCWVHSDKRVVPVAIWSCAEWKFDGAANQMQFWLNGEEITSLTVAGTGQACMHQPAAFPWSAPDFERIDLGWESYAADAARTIWIDDVAVGTQRVGCPAL